jgi:ribosome biogenesis protein ENP2
LTGTYKPQIHTHHLPHLSLSFARHTTSLNQTFLLLSSDYSKSLHLQTDRSLEFHTPQGCHYTTRIPRYGRDLKYDKRSAEALIPAVGVNGDGNGEVFRLNLEVGRYMRGYEVDVGGDDVGSIGAGALQGGVRTGSVNTAVIAEDSHNLLAFGTSIGTVEFWDARSRGRVGVLANKSGITALEFHRGGLTMATGDSDGVVQLFDLRSPVPLLRKDQGYGYPIQTLMFLNTQSSEDKILSADKRIIKIWDQATGDPWTSVEPAVDINHVAWCRDSGMFLTANEGRQQHAFFIPQLGPAPKWCSFLDNIVEEMAEDANDPNSYQAGGAVYDNYKFLTVPQLKTLNLAHLIGTTNLLRPYMHGYFVAQKLYEEARLIADPYVWEEQRAKRVQETIDKVRASRIRGIKKVDGVKVNRKLAEKIIDRRKNAEQETEDGLLKDSRFSRLFQDDEFAVDEASREFQSLNPSTKPMLDMERRRKTAVEEEEKDATRRRDSSGNSSSDDAESEKEQGQKKESDAQNRISSASYKRSGHRPQMKISSSKAQPKDRSFGSRNVKFSGPGSKKGTVTGDKEITFEPERRGKPKSTAREGVQRGERRDKGRRSASGNVFRNL